MRPSSVVQLNTHSRFETRCFDAQSVLLLGQVGNFPTMETRHGSMGKPVPGPCTSWICSTTRTDCLGHTNTAVTVTVALFTAASLTDGGTASGFDVDIVSENAEREPFGEIGHIDIRCADDEPWPPGLFHGYLQADGTVDSSPFRSGWYFTGDMGHKDEDGYIWFEVSS